MKSKYDTATCPKCKNKIAIGDDISKDDGQPSWHHTKCPTQEEPKPEPPKPEQKQLPVKEEEPVKAEAKNFDDEKFKTEAKIICNWARVTANSINFPENFNKTQATTDELRARQIDRNVDKKDLFAAFYLVKYGKKLY